MTFCGRGLKEDLNRPQILRMPCDIGLRKKKKKLHKWWRGVSKRLEDLVTCKNRDDTFTVSAQAQAQMFFL